VVQRDVVAAKVARARGWIHDAARFLLGPQDVYLTNPERRDLALFYLFLAIQVCIDVAAHWVADDSWGEPDDAASVFDVLAERRVIDGQRATTLRAAAGQRNRIAHGYAMLGYARAHREAQDGIPALRAFLAAVATAADL
jgi:uncharacterized protein YutE (UPF0331/DUF86 family)